MAYASEPTFLVLHALRVKGFAKVDTLSELAARPIPEVEGHLRRLEADGHAVFREARSLWQLTPEGKEAHASALADDVSAAPIDHLKKSYPSFLELNDAFKLLCGDWQLRDGQPNDHSDSAYDRAVIGRLRDLDHEARPVCATFGEVMLRLSPYGGRLQSAAERVANGERNLFTGVMCGSYHDVWMELHEDLILTLRIDRTSEGSF